MIKLYIANLGKYNEGELVGDWITLPYEEYDLNELFVKIGLGTMVDGEYKHGKVEVDDKGYSYIYEEYAIHDSECEIEGLEIGEYSSLERLNNIAQAFEETDDWDIKCFEALVELGYVGVEDISDSGDIRLKLEQYCFSELDEQEKSVSVYNSDKALGYHLAEMNDVDSKLDELGLSFYFDYQAYGRDARLNGVSLASNDIVVM